MIFGCKPPPLIVVRHGEMPSMLYTLPFCGLLKPVDLIIFVICNILFINFNYPCYSVSCINKDTVKSTLTIGRANG